MPSDEILRRFTYHAPGTVDVTKFEALRSTALGLADKVDKLCPDCREKSLALTKIEEAIMWANASIARS
jgi:hypothetical protein